MYITTLLWWDTAADKLDEVVTTEGATICGCDWLNCWCWCCCCWAVKFKSCKGLLCNEAAFAATAAEDEVDNNEDDEDEVLLIATEPTLGCGAGRLLWRNGAVGGIWCPVDCKNHGSPPVCDVPPTVTEGCEKPRWWPTTVVCPFWLAVMWLFITVLFERSSAAEDCAIDAFGACIKRCVCCCCWSTFSLCCCFVSFTALALAVLTACSAFAVLTVKTADVLAVSFAFSLEFALVLLLIAGVCLLSLVLLWLWMDLVFVFLL